MKNYPDLTGQRFGRLIAIKPIDKFNYLCKCDCGNEKIVSKYRLRSGQIQSCGCLRKETSAKNGAAFLKTHASYYGKIYGAKNQKYAARASADKRKIYPELNHDKIFYKLLRVYKNMFKRCSTYKTYIDKNIQVCNEWKEDFRNFYYWAINNGFDINKPWQQCTLDRINNNANYSPENYRWVNLFIQQRNKNDNRLITYNNETYCIAEWADKFNLTRYKTIKFLNQLKGESNVTTR